MKTSIRMKIFLPMSVILIAFPLAVWFMLRYTLNEHMNNSVRRDLELTIARVERVINENHLAMAAAETIGAEEDPEMILTLLQDELQVEGTETRLMAVSGGYRVLYPVNFDDRPEMAEFYPLFLTKATGTEEFWEQGRILEEIVGEETYLLYYRRVEGADTDQIRHLILYTPIYDTKAILDQMSQFVLWIMIGIAAVAIVLFWFVAGSISGPLIRLCEAARGIGEKKFKKVETGATVKELLQLEAEINQMQEKLAQADQAERTFFQNASHELRTPLMSISGYAQGIQCGVFEDTAQAARIPQFDKVMREGQRFYLGNTLMQKGIQSPVFTAANGFDTGRDFFIIDGIDAVYAEDPQCHQRQKGKPQMRDEQTAEDASVFPCGRHLLLLG